MKILDDLVPTVQLRGAMMTSKGTALTAIMLKCHLAPNPRRDCLDLDGERTIPDWLTSAFFDSYRNDSFL